MKRVTDVIAGRFALCDPIARGGSGTVWRAYDRRVGRFCAAKVLRRRDAGELLRFVREQSVRVAHPNVLTPYSWAAEDAHVVIASELVEGGSLATLVGDHGPLTEATVAVLLDQLLAALEAVHGAGLVHRDVKPANVLLHASRTGPVHSLLGDFGLAMNESDARLTQVGMVVGTPGYVAPELLTGAAGLDPRQDLFAAGRVAAALLLGTEPSGAGAEPDLRGVRDHALRHLIDGLTAVTADRRPATAGQARAFLHAHVRADAHPRGRDGNPVDVRPQLPALPADIDEGELTGSQTRNLSPIPIAAAATGAIQPQADTPVATAAVRNRRTRTTLIGAAAAVVVAVVGTAIALSRSSTGNSPTTPHKLGHDLALQVVRSGSPCSWQDENDQAFSTTGATLVCRVVDGRYVWT